MLSTKTDALEEACAEVKPITIANLVKHFKSRNIAITEGSIKSYLVKQKNMTSFSQCWGYTDSENEQDKKLVRQQRWYRLKPRKEKNPTTSL